MSSVVIAGNTSGSVTLLAPDVAGSVVVTLPSSSMTLAAGPGGMQAFTANGTFTIPAGKTAVKVTVVGGGGGGRYSNGSSGGGGGGAAVSVLTGLTPGATITVTIGAAGAAGTNIVDAGAGGTSSVSSGTQTITTISATGGNGAANGGLNSLGGFGGLGSGGQLNLRGGAGIYGDYVATCGTTYFPGVGGSTILTGNAQAGQNGVNGGGGGSGTVQLSPNAIPGAGGVGIVVFEW